MSQPRRRRKSSISRLPDEQRRFIETLIREGRHTLDEMLAAIRERFPNGEAASVSRSALHRYDNAMTVLAGRMREIETMSQTLVGELGDGLGEKTGELLAQAITTLAANATLKAHENDNITIEEVRRLAVAAKNALDTQRVGLNVRRQIAEEARQKLLREQREKLDALGKTGAIDPAALQLVIKTAYDL